MSGDLSSDRLPPQSVEAEQSVLGAILIENDALLKCIDVLTEDDLYRESHRKIFRAMLELFDKSEAIDIVTVTEVLSRKNELDAVGGATYIAALASQVPTAANIKYHSKIVREKALLRSLLRSSTDIATRVYEASDEAEELLDFAEKSIFDISDKRIKNSLVHVKSVVHESFKMIEELYERKEVISGVATGFRDLDAMTTGFQRGDLIIVGGRPSMGKTAFSLNVAQHVGIVNKEPVAVFSLEMSTRQLVTRMLCAEARVNSNKVRQGFIGKQDWQPLTNAAARIQESPIFIDDSSNVNVLEMRAKARRMKMEHGLSMVVVDYLQLMRGRSNFERREQEISDISRSLKALAKELDIPVVALSQLNRGVETRTGDKRPTLADLRESGAIEQDADVIIFLYRDFVYNKHDLSKKNKAELIVAKQRNGPTGTVHVTFLDEYTRFEDQAQEYYGDGPMDEDEVDPF